MLDHVAGALTAAVEHDHGWHRRGGRWKVDEKRALQDVAVVVDGKRAIDEARWLLGGGAIAMQGGEQRRGGGAGQERAA
jgi:hypothetical protein